MKTSDIGKKLIIDFEGIKLNAYKCPAGIPTIGVGNTFYLNGSKVKMGDKITLPQAMELFESLLPKYEKTVNDNIKVALTQNQFDALVCFCWNCGSSNTLFSLINQKSIHVYDWWISHYTKGGGKELAGLVIRRKAEASLFVS